MNHRNYCIYKNIMSVHPKIDEKYLTEILRLESSETIKQMDVSEVVESNTALVIRVSVHISSEHNEQIKKLFIKTAKPDNINNSYHEMSMREGSFYKLLLEHPNIDVPAPGCYDVFISEETNEFVIVLDDLSEHYKTAGDNDLLNENIWFSCAESLARFHASFWNDSRIAKGELAKMSKQKIEADICSNQEYLNSFLKEFQNRFDERTIKIYEHAMSINSELMRECSKRTFEKNNVTVCNGDSHIYNFLIPSDNAYKPIMVDFQFWGDGLGVGDLAHLTRVNFSEEHKKNIQMSLIKKYHETLQKYGAVDYSWEECLNDYRKEVAAMVLIPVWQHCCFGLKYEDWIGDVEGLVNNYEYMKCDEVYEH